jgi:hypothetical protein
MRIQGTLPQAAGQARSRVRRRLRLDPRGQGLVEFAISFPIVMLMILFGVDFGRVFVGWVTLTNAVREAANFAAINPNAWDVPGSPNARAEFARLINAESAEINCTLPATLPDPSFPNGNSLGSPAIVAITCEFSLITPIIGNILGNPLDVSASASFPIRSGSINGTPIGATLPSFSPAAPTPTPEITVETDPTETPIPTPSMAPTPIPTCVVPDLITAGGVRTNQATQAWTGAGFAANNLVFNPLVPPHYRIRTQSLDPNDSWPCTSSMTVTP